MADLTQTPANVKAVGTPPTRRENSGEAITAGDLVYLKAADGKWYKASNATAAEATLSGIALSSAPGADQPVTVQTGDIVEPGATVTVGEIYVASANAGKIAPEGDLISTKFVSIFGVGITAARIQIGILNSGVQVP